MFKPDYLKDEYVVWRETFFAKCFLECIRLFLRNDGLEFCVVVDGETPVPQVPPSKDFSRWSILDKHSPDKIIVRIYKDSAGPMPIHRFSYNIKDFIEEYDHDKDSIFDVFNRMTDVFQKDYIKWYMETEGGTINE